MALVWANSPWAASYFGLWEAHVVVGGGVVVGVSALRYGWVGLGAIGAPMAHQRMSLRYQRTLRVFGPLHE